MASFNEFPPPPRLTADDGQNAKLILDWSQQFYNSVGARLRSAEARLDAVAALAPLATTATLADTIAKVNEIIAAAAEQEA